MREGGEVGAQSESVCQESGGGSPSFRETLIIDCVAVVGSKALSVKAPWLCLHSADYRYWGKCGRGIIHDRRGPNPPLLPRRHPKPPPVWNLRGGHGSRSCPYQPPGTMGEWLAALTLAPFPYYRFYRAQKNPVVCLVQGRVLFLSLCVWREWCSACASGQLGGCLGRRSVAFLSACVRERDIFSISAVL